MAKRREHVVWSWSAMRAPPDWYKIASLGPKFCRAHRTQIIGSFTTDIKLGLIIRRLLPAALIWLTSPQGGSSTHLVAAFLMLYTIHTFVQTYFVACCLGINLLPGTMQVSWGRISRFELRACDEPVSSENGDPPKWGPQVSIFIWNWGPGSLIS